MASAPSLDRINLARFKQATQRVELATADFAKLIETTARDLARDDKATSDSFFLRVGFGASYYSISETDVVLRPTTKELAASTIDIDVSSRIAAAGRSPEQLQNLVDCSVVDYYDRKREAIPKGRYNSVRVGSFTVRIASDADGTAEMVATALLDVRPGVNPALRMIDRWPPPTAPFWGMANLLVAICMVALAAAPVGAVWLTISGLTLAVVVLATLTIARRRGASVPKTGLGMLPATLIVLFALFYGSFMIGTHPSVHVSGRTPHLVDAFLLSFGIASTGGFLDVGIHGTGIRIAALIEMLAMVGVAGGSLYAGARSVWARLTEMVGNRSQQ